VGTPLTFTRAKAGAGDFLCVAGVPDGAEPFVPFTRLCRYDAADPEPVKWFYDDLPIAVTAIVRFAPQAGDRESFCVLSAEGDVILMRPPFPREKIPGAGISSPDSERWGRMAHLRVIGDHLYACGDGGQIYGRAGGAFGSGQWRPLDPALLVDPAARVDWLLRRAGAAPVAHEVFTCVNGPREDELYVVGTHGAILAWDGAAFTTLPKLTDATLTRVLVEDDERIWICGRGGTLLRGNRRDGFRDVGPAGGNQAFTSMARFDDELYLASIATPRGLFVYDRGRCRQVASGLEPDIADAHTVESMGGALWVVGSKDILRFDGARWERIDHVDNPPVR